MINLFSVTIPPISIDNKTFRNININPKGTECIIETEIRYDLLQYIIKCDRVWGNINVEGSPDILESMVDSLKVTPSGSPSGGDHSVISVEMRVFFPSLIRLSHSFHYRCPILRMMIFLFSISKTTRKSSILIL